MRAGTLNIWGPYRDAPNKYRLKISENGETRSICFRTYEEAELAKARLRDDIASQQVYTIGEAISQFCAHLAETRGIKAESVAWTAAQLEWLPENASLASINQEKAEKLYKELTVTPNPRTGKLLATATHHGRLGLARRLYEFAIKQDMCRNNPFASVTPIGRKRVGKPQLRIDEARRFEQKAIELAQAGDAAALGALLMLHLGLRQGEVAARIARDVDDEGRVLWVPSGKTKNARRRLKVPEVLRPLLLRQVEITPPGALLFYKGEKVPPTNYFWSQVRRLCHLAEVPAVCPHSLRGLHATLALEGGATADAVARALGHGSFSMTARHYASESSVDNAKATKVSSLLGGQGAADGPKSSGPDPDQILGLLKSLPAQQLAELLSKVSRSAE
ncbi:MAG: tyrosine-type recombinase/integrase [Myxococcales bacterium]|nr:tyrosine-type recombinase/integrase [Myxococcales bacterium]